MLKQSEKESILSNFPNVKLSYENFVYKKVYNSALDYIVIVPKGNKCFAWFTIYKNKNVCFIMELTSNKQISDIKIFNVCFNHELAYGTIFYGTLFYTSNNRFFSIEDILLYKGNNINNSTWHDKLTLLNNIFKKDLKQVSFNNSFIVFGLPIICKSNEELEKKIKTIDYNIDSIHFYFLNKINNFLSISYSDYLRNQFKNQSNQPNQPKNQSYETTLTEKKAPLKKEQIFIIRPDIQDDIYYLHVLDNELKEKNIGTTHIPNFDTSVMMNKLFRIIKENENLDALEESDNEEEFENVDIDKFVKLETTYKMLCQYNYKFKKWMPIRLVNNNSKIITIDEFNNLTKSFEQNNKQFKPSKILK
jgi:hypothetical protein